MTDHSHDRTAARELRDLTDRPYQACVTTIRVLRPLAHRIDLGDLASVFGRSDDRGRLIAVPADALDINPRVTYGGSPVPRPFARPPRPRARVRPARAWCLSGPELSASLFGAVLTGRHRIVHRRAA